MGLGLLVGLIDRVDLPPGLMAIVGGGLLGSFTTFSTFTWETARLLAERTPGKAGLYVALSLGGGLLTAAAGLATAALPAVKVAQPQPSSCRRSSSMPKW